MTTKVSDKNKRNRIQLITKSDNLILSHYNMTANENKLLVLAVSKIRDMFDVIDNVPIIPDKDITVSIPVKEIKTYLNISGQSIYSNLRSMSEKITSIKIEILDEGKKEFTYIVPFPRATLQKGVFEITFEQFMINNIANLDNKNYTLLSTEDYRDMKLSYSMRLYEILRSYMYSQEYVFISLRELKKQLGVIVTYVYRNGTKKRDETDKYPLWADLNRFVLKKACQEICENTEINVTYEPRRKGRAIEEILFLIDKKSDEEIKKLYERKKVEAEKKETAKNVEPIVMAGSEYLRNVLNGDGIKQNQIIRYIDAAQGNENLIIDAYIKYKKASLKETIDDIDQWIVNAIREKL